MRSCPQDTAAGRRVTPDGPRHAEVGRAPRTLANLAETQLALGDRAAARDNLQAALRLLDDLGHADAARVRSRLDDLETSSTT
jgi:hypothetical protein